MAGGQREDRLQLLLTPQCAFRSLQHWLVRRAYAGDLDHEVAVAPRPSAARRIPRGERSGMLSRRTQFGHNRRAEPRRRGWRLRLEPFSRFPRQEFCRWKRRRLRRSISPECSEVSPSGTQDGHNFHQWDRDRAVTTEQNWWAGTGLNRRHQDFQSCALPTELPAHQTREDNRRARRRPLPGRRIGGYSTDETTPSAPDFSK
jgi:hypothetical protein